MTGFICIDKPENMTSFTAANLVKRITGSKKAGHTGTLDPMATGVLTVALSGATRFIELIPDHEKSYTARILLGVTTDTLDITGTVTGSFTVSVTPCEAKEAALSFYGEQLQTPPMYSAVSKDGVRLYDLARQGKEIEREKRKINITEIRAYDFSDNEFSLDVTCSAGTYIRSLADDIGKKLGCGAVLKSLRRTRANGFSTDDCITIEKLREICENGELGNYVMPVSRVLSQYKEVHVTAAQAVRFKNGGELFLDRIGNPKGDGFFRVFSPENEFLGIGEKNVETGCLAVKRVLQGE